MRSEKEKMLAGQLYNSSAPEIQADQVAAAAWMARYNASLSSLPRERLALLRERLAEVGDGSVVDRV